MTRSWLLIILVVMMGMPAAAMIRTLAFPDLVKQAEVILIAEVTAQEISEIAGKPYPKVKTELKVEKLVKGKVESKDPIVFNTFGTLEQYLEDSPVFPPKGGRALLFLKKEKDGTMSLVNGIQGLWPLKPGSDQTLGMGFRYSLKLVEEEVAKP